MLDGECHVTGSCLNWMLRTCHRFSDRDLLMRYHWGLGISHLHCTPTFSSKSGVHEAASWLDDEPNDITQSAGANYSGDDHLGGLDYSEMAIEDSNLVFDPDPWDDTGSNASDSENSDGNDFQWDELNAE